MNSDDELVEFLIRETGEHLYLVLEYGPDSWERRYASDVADEVIAGAGVDIDDLLDTFRREGGERARLDRVFGLGGYYCSLHLFGDLALLHFGGTDEHGIVLGYAPAAASHLTDFVAVVLPYVRRDGLDDMDGDPTWAST